MSRVSRVPVSLASVKGVHATVQLIIKIKITMCRTAKADLHLIGLCSTFSNLAETRESRGRETGASSRAPEKRAHQANCTRETRRAILNESRLRTGRGGDAGGRLIVVIIIIIVAVVVVVDADDCEASSGFVRDDTSGCASHSQWLFR